MFNSDTLFSNYLNQRALIWQSSESQDQFSYEEIIKGSKTVKSALQEFFKNDQNNIGVLLNRCEIIPVIIGYKKSYSGLYQKQ